jgi:protein-S-isoprenylcysteine O-methyltransferase Ste14
MTSKPLMVFITLLATTAYFGLAVWGSGGVGAFFSEPARIALTIVGFALVAAALLTQGHIGAGEREDRGNRWAIAAFGVLGLLLGYLPAYTERQGILIIDGDAVRWIGVILNALGGALRIYPVFVLGRCFSGLVAIQPGHTLVTDGIYGVIRHPSYLGLILNALGWVLAFRSGVGVLLTVLLVPPLVARMRAEEALLRAHFGGDYETYCKRTSRLVPGVY